MSDEIYKEIIMDHYKNPRNFGKIEKPDFSAEDSNPLCGDHVEMAVKIEDGKVADVKFIGRGCAISMSAASIITELIQGMSIEDLRKFDKEQLLEAMGNPDLGPVRVKCALLPLKTLKLGLYTYLSKTDDSAGK
ncbi:MAG TPA: SUF system NifU family Fe-S cluster assembly protein [Conexivisphaerales archaeon]|nr:SUF system NifU family Fe-S cluster assembly protein [Conexivisphaerales archaeon]